MILSYKPISVQIQQKRHQNNVHERCSSLSTIEFVGNKATGQISKRVLQENEERQIFQKTNISYPLVRIRMCVSGSKKYSIKFGMLYFLVTLVLRFTFLPYYRWIKQARGQRTQVKMDAILAFLFARFELVWFLLWDCNCCLLTPFCLFSNKIFVSRNYKIWLNA